MIDLFHNSGVHCVVDGQFGSTGKGALSAWLAHEAFKDDPNFNFAGVIYSGGPNSGHTSYFEGEKIVLKQLPTFAVHLLKLGIGLPVHLSAGAVIDPVILKKEAEEYPELPIFVHPNAAVVTDMDRATELSGVIAEVAGTRSGTGAAIARKVFRDPTAIAKNSLKDMPNNVMVMIRPIFPDRYAYFMEVAQGFSLGLNSEFYPKVTSRECTVMQGLADARIAPRHLRRTYMAIRTYPIRVGNIDGFSSGDWYSDQHEESWEDIGVEPELTTVTHRVRRVATFSWTQLMDACRANDPDFVFVSHMDYLETKQGMQFLRSLQLHRGHLDKRFGIILGRGPLVSNVHMLEEP